MKFLLCSFLLFAEINLCLMAFDDYFIGIAKFNCFKERLMSGCKQTGYPTDIGIHLFTEQNKDNPENLHQCGGRLPSNTLFNPQKNTVIIIPGYLAYVCLVLYPRDFKEQLIFRDGSNVIIVDWMYEVGEILDYYVATRYVKHAANKIFTVLKNVMDQTGISPGSIHIIGHSLGAHIAGVVGYLMQGSLGIITGLDPAGPGFREAPLEERLDRTDAVIVVAIHTNIGNCLPYLGDPRAIGHADFYLVEKKVKMSCLPQALHSFLRGDLLVGLFNLDLDQCSHIQVVEIFKASINPCNCQFIGVECESESDFESGKCNSCGPDGSECAVMGMDYVHYPRPNGTRKYYLDTAILCPYCYNNTRIDTSNFPKKPTDGTPMRCYPY